MLSLLHVCSLSELLNCKTKNTGNYFLFLLPRPQMYVKNDGKILRIWERQSLECQ